jgi:hypothetical protein
MDQDFLEFLKYSILCRFPQRNVWFHYLAHRFPQISIIALNNSEFTMFITSIFTIF